jgi:DNA invertase Pin-like site-specific DNA recombinase
MTSTLIGYARCSSSDQKLHNQVATLETLGVRSENIYRDHGFSGISRDRDGLRDAMAACRRGDVLVVTRVDRLSRRTVDALNIAQELRTRDVLIQIDCQPIDVHNGNSLFIFTMLAAVASMEYDMIRSRTAQGIEKAKVEGKYLGGNFAQTTAEERRMITKYRQSGVTQHELADLFGVSRATVARAVARDAELRRLHGETVFAPLDS